MARFTDLIIDMYMTVNQPSYDFEGSSPSSPTSLRSLRELGWASQRGSLVANERRLPRRSPQGEGGLFKRFASFGWASQHGSLVANG